MIEFKENTNSILSGELFIKLIDTKTNKVILEESDKNLIVDNGLLTMAGLLTGNYVDYEITQMAFGDGTSPAISGDSDLRGDYYRKKGIDTTKTTIFGANIARIYWDIVFDDDIGGQTFEGGIGGAWSSGDTFTIREFGLYTANETLFNRLVWTGADLTMSSGIRLEGYFAITVTR